MTTHRAGTREEWPAARLGLLRDEKELTRRSGDARGLIPDLIGRAAAPTFALMALLTGVLDKGSPDMLCVGAPDASPLSGMVPMYVLMSVFHSAPWLKLIAGRRSGGDFKEALEDDVRSNSR
jgi:hypothetical protein